MNTPPFWLVDDGRDHDFRFLRTPTPSMEDDFNGFFKTFTNSFDSSVKYATATSIVAAVLMTVAIVAIVIAVIDCLKKAGTAIPAYARVATDDMEDGTTQKTPPLSENINIAVVTPPVYSLIPNSRVEGQTMEEFLSNLARERPVRFSPQQLEQLTHGFSTTLGRGGFGIVYRGELVDGVPVAVKVLTNNSDKRVREQFMAEVSTIGRTYHVNLVRLYGFCFEPTMRALVYECMENGSLDSLLFGEDQTAIEWRKLHEIAIGTAKGIAYLHEECQKRIIHYDIKPENVLLDANLNPKVADFGLAKLCNTESSHVLMSGYRGTAGYAAPELWKPYPVTHKCDVYSFGILLFEVVGRRRHHNPNLSETRERLPRWSWEMFERNELAEMVSLLGIEESDREKAERALMVALWCVQDVPEARPAMSTVVKMLEGGIEITRPTYPFRVSVLANNGDNDSSDPSTSMTQTHETSQSNPMEGPGELELASVV